MEINLLPERERKKSNTILIFAISLILFITILLWFFIQYITLTRDIETLSSDEAYSLEEQVDLTTNLESVKTSSEGDLIASVSFAENISYPVSPLLIEVNSLLEKHTYLRKYEFLEQQITLTLDVETMSTISRLVTNLSASEYFNDIKVESVTSFDIDSSEQENKVYFEIIPRYSAELTLEIDSVYLKNGGVTP
ncbi:PilN domain-containing protein [Psychrobacillus sp. FSL W7-1493]|uniref:PilN domain-containing protein n=1 Tax=Psychrobacillus sp. FSL W7-1493 TaxID=2921552 RepID=UPI0030FBB2FF